jgi:hypothetical protein
MAENDTALATAITVAVLQEKLSALEERLQRSDSKIKALEKDRDNAIKWGLMILGTAVVSMASWIFKLITVKAP